MSAALGDAYFSRYFFDFSLGIPAQIDQDVAMVGEESPRLYSAHKATIAENKYRKYISGIVNEAHLERTFLANRFHARPS